MGDRIGQDSPDGHSGKGCNAAEGADEEELLPDGDPDIGMDFCSDLSSLQHAMQPFYARTRSPGQLSENDPLRPGRLRDDPCCFLCGTKVGAGPGPGVCPPPLSVRCAFSSLLCSARIVLSPPIFGRTLSPALCVCLVFLLPSLPPVTTHPLLHTPPLSGVNGLRR